ncbi:MAG: TraB/GumN family protein [Bacteroidota bacterium]
MRNILVWLMGLVSGGGMMAQALPASDSVPEIPQSLLWRIEHPEWKAPSYVFGTIHMIGAEDFFWPEELDTSFAQTQQLALEVDMDDPAQMALMLTGSMMKDGSSLSSLLDSAEFARVSRFFEDSVKMPVMMLQRMKPMLLGSMFYPLMLKGKTLSYEQELLKKAKAADMEVIGVESLADQLAMMDSIPYQEQAQMLVTQVDSFQQQKAQLQSMIDLYKTQNLEELQRLMESEEDLEDHQDVMLNDRNARWIPVIQRESTAMPTFYAVGAGHLAGEKGVLALLKAAGCSVQPVL